MPFLLQFVSECSHLLIYAGRKWLDVIGHYTHPVWKCDDFRAWLHFWSKISLIYVREYFQLWILCSGLFSVVKIQVFNSSLFVFYEDFHAENLCFFFCRGPFSQHCACWYSLLPHTGEKLIQVHMQSYLSLVQSSVCTQQPYPPQIHT